MREERFSASSEKGKQRSSVHFTSWNEAMGTIDSTRPIKIWQPPLVPDVASLSRNIDEPLQPKKSDRASSELNYPSQLNLIPQLLSLPLTHLFNFS